MLNPGLHTMSRMQSEHTFVRDQCLKNNNNLFLVKLPCCFYSKLILYHCMSVLGTISDTGSNIICCP
jgi:hypothetical protein